MPRTKLIVGITIPVVIILIMIPIASSSTNLMQLGQQSEKTTFISKFSKTLDNCSGALGLNLSNCKQAIGSLQSQCTFYGNPAVCTDPRIDRTITAKTANLANAKPTNFTTYTSNKFGFSIAYPSDWATSEYPPYWNETRIVNFTDNQQTPDAMFVIKERHNNDDSFKNVVTSYLLAAGVSGYPINLQSEDKVTIGNKEAYRIQYVQPIGSAKCKYEDYAINDGKFVPIISFSDCDEDAFEQFLPTYETMVSTFRTMW